MRRLRARSRLHGVGLMLAMLAMSAVAEPRTDYLLHCMGCHLADGTGTPPGIPALRERVGYYLQIPGGRNYLMQVPGAANAPLSDDRLAAVLNWVIAEFARGSEPGDWQPFSTREVAASRGNGPADVDAWRHELWGEIEARFPSAPGAY